MGKRMMCAKTITEIERIACIGVYRQWMYTTYDVEKYKDQGLVIVNDNINDLHISLPVLYPMPELRARFSVIITQDYYL